MRVAFAADHAGAALKLELKRLQTELGDEGQFSKELPVDKPDKTRPPLTDIGFKSVAEAITAAKATP